MSHSCAIVCMMSLCLVIAQPSLFSQTGDGAVRNSFGVGAGYSISIGDWSKARVAPDVSLLNGNITVGADLEFAVSERLILAVSAGFAPLSGGDWEAYARSRGDVVSVTASVFHVALVLRPSLKITRPDLIRAELGPVVLVPSGRETFAGKSYNYDFFETIRIGGQGGIVYDRMLGESVAVSLRVAAIVVPAGVTYADGESRTVISLPLTVGVRFMY